jgi:hypothetical protein
MPYEFVVEKSDVVDCRRMDSKSESEEMIYPYVCFSVDNFDEAFEDIQVLRYLRGRAPPHMHCGAGHLLANICMTARTRVFSLIHM